MHKNMFAFEYFYSFYFRNYKVKGFCVAES